MRRQSITKIVRREWEKTDRRVLLEFLNVFILFCSFMLGIMLIFTGMGEIRSFREEFFSRIFFMLPLLWTLTGCLLVFSFILGAIGCLKESSVLILIQALLLICSSVVAFLFRHIFVTEIPKNNSDLVRAKGIFWHLFAKVENISDSESFENLQDILGCCGVDSFDDWSAQSSNITSGGQSQYDLPSTCCIQLSPPEEFYESPAELFCHSNLPTTLAEKTATSEMEFLRIYDSGCYVAFRELLQTNGELLIPISTAAAAAFLILAFVAAWHGAELFLFHKQERDFKKYCEKHAPKLRKSNPGVLGDSGLSNDTKKSSLPSEKDPV